MEYLNLNQINTLCKERNIAKVEFVTLWYNDETDIHLSRFLDSEGNEVDGSYLILTSLWELLNYNEGEYRYDVKENTLLPADLNVYSGHSAEYNDEGGTEYVPYCGWRN